MPDPATYAASKLTGRAYRVTDGLCTELSIPYQVLTPRLAAAPGLDEITGFPVSGAAPGAGDCTGLNGAAALVLTDVDVTEDESGIKWLLTAVYRQSSASSVYTPLGEEIEYTAKITHGTKMVDVKSAWDWDGKPFLNSAKRPYDDVPPLRVPAKVVSVEKRLKARVTVEDISGTANASAVTIDGTTFDAGCAVIDATCETTGDRKWPFSLRFTVEELINIDDQGTNTGCRINIVNSGWEYYIGDTLVRATVEDEKGEPKPSPTPVLLDETGEKLADPDAGLTSIQYRLAREATWPEWVSA